MAAMQPAMSHHAMQHGYAQGHMYGVDATVDPAMAGMGMLPELFAPVACRRLLYSYLRHGTAHVSPCGMLADLLVAGDAYFLLTKSAPPRPSSHKQVWAMATPTPTRCLARLACPAGATLRTSRPSPCPAALPCPTMLTPRLPTVPVLPAALATALATSTARALPLPTPLLPRLPGYVFVQ